MSGPVGELGNSSELYSHSKKVSKYQVNNCHLSFSGDR